MEEFVTNASGIKIAVSRERVSREEAVIIAPGFFTSKDTKTYRRIAADLRKTIDVIAMDFRGHGKSEGRYTYSAREKEDLKAVVDHARCFYKRVGVLGFSYGAAIAIIEAAEFRNVDSLACIGSPMASEAIEFRWWTPQGLRLGVLKFEWGNGVRSGNPFLEKTRPIDVVAKLSPAPVFFIHGTGDPTVDVRHSRRLFETAKEPKKLKIFEKGSHAEEIYKRYPKEFIAEVTDWFGQTLKAKIGAS